MAIGVCISGPRGGGGATPSPTVTIVASNSTPNYTDTITLSETTSGAATVNWTITDGVDIYEATGNPINLDTTQFGYGTLTIEAITIDTLVGRGTSSVTVSNTPEDIYDAFDAVASVSNADIKSAWVECIRDINRDSSWSDILAIAPIIGGASAAHSVDMKNPANLITWFGSPTHNSKGVLLNGTTQYGTSWFNAQAQGLNKNSAGMGYVNGYGGSGNILMGEGGLGTDFYMRQFGGSVIGVNSASAIDASNDSGFSMCVRETSTYVYKLSNLSLDASSAVSNSQTTWVNVPIYLGRTSTGYGAITLCQFACIVNGISVAESKGIIKAVNKCNARIR